MNLVESGHRRNGGDWRAALKRFPIIEVFGPTIQGEGFLAGLPTHFVRVGGCDYRCSWCDSMFAVEPAEVRAHAEWLTAWEIVDRLDELQQGPNWVTLSGGNPALHRLGQVVEALHAHDYGVAVETQGSIWRDWLATVDHLTVSPKPPSSGMDSWPHATQADRFLEEAARQVPIWARSLKIVVFDEDDYQWARNLLMQTPMWPSFLSVGTDQHPPATLEQIADRYRWLCERVAADSDLADVRVLPQLHVVAWGHARGV